ncbi:receptor-like protein kinase [Tripterygium wilfordii]|uniref:non-specific serine/threonine protein kinase n=1 Tax=Tripterygium wilfordii TaxID=458696 RepID=A0A7J7C6R1_TRIWF|nr:probable receptor-like protein kinase At4g10390 [Tripterygium wilfordii]KAF5729819.1 receptor-like protein kinase [Tripterygium wilfordii]
METVGEGGDAVFFYRRLRRRFLTIDCLFSHVFLVCGCGGWWSMVFIFSLFSISSQLCFCVASFTSSPTPNTSPTSPIDPPTGPLNRQKDDHFHRKIAIAVGVSAGFLFFLLILMGFLATFLLRLRRKRRPRKQNVVGIDDNGVNEEKGKIVDDGFGNGVKKYNWDEILKITMDFSKVVGSGGFSTVYLARLLGLDSTMAAVKIFTSDHLNRVFKQELEILLNLQHDNIVKFLGYCDNENNQDHEEGALVFEFVPNGTLQEKLHEIESDSKVLSWRRRMAIVFQLGQAIEYLHEHCSLQIVHGDIKASNILLDQNLNCKLCDFGSAKMGFSSMVMPSKKVMMGSPGYTDPHYMRTGIASKKNDIYSYGVIILELVTGMQAFCSTKCQLLTSVLGPNLRDIDHCEAKKLKEMVDPLLGSDFNMEEVRAMLSISSRCLGQSPTLRPSATQILLDMKDSVSSISFLSSPEKK